MTLLSLGYIGISTSQLSDWMEYGPSLLGLQAVDTSKKTVSFRMDDRCQRLHVEEDGKGEFRYIGWEVSNKANLDQLAAKLEAHGVSVHVGESALAEQRRVTELIWFEDPAGNRLEAFYGGEIATDAFKPGRNISGFRTGALGLGHAVLTCENIGDLMPFYTEILNFRLSDFALQPFKAYFFHLNPRHHSLALIETGKNGVHHLMMELMNFDDVGQGYDLAGLREGNIGSTLGRHNNDLITSFYSWTPSSFMVEYGWGGREIDPATWEAVESKDGPSLWGHDRTWLDDKGRAVALDLRLGAAKKGHRAPVQVLPGNHEIMSPNCLWWDGLKK